MSNILEILAKKRDGKALSWEDAQFVMQGAVAGNIRESQLGAFMMACHLRGLSNEETDLLMRAMMFSGELLVWPREWVEKMASLQSIGSTGNKAKLILAPAMAACGLKFPILSSRGRDIMGGVLSKLSVIPGFDGCNKTLENIQNILDDVGCCVVQQPSQVAPAERIIRDIAGQTTVSINNAFKEACMIARVGALKLNAVVMEIPYGPGETTKSKSAAEDMAKTLTELSKSMGIKCHVVTTGVVRPIGQTVGQSLEVAEAIKCPHGQGAPDLHELVCRLGGHILQEAGIVETIGKGEELVGRKLKDGSARKKFGEMLHAQGVDKADVKVLLKQKKDDDAHLWTVLPAAHFFTHLSAQEAGFIHHIDVTVLNEIIFELVESANLTENKRCAGGIQLLSRVGAYLNTGELWAKIHHNEKLATNQIERLMNAITLRAKPSQADMTIDIDVIEGLTVTSL